MSGKGEEAHLTVPKFSSFKSTASSSAKPNKAGDSSDKASVPKFSSFKSSRSESSSAHRKGSEKRQDELSDDGKKRHRHGKDDGHQSKRRRHESHQRGEGRRRRSKSPEDRSHRHSKVAKQDLTVPKSDHFFIDKKGDPLIIKFGGLERSKIPAYHRYGGGRVLGTSGRLWIHREGARDQFSLQMPGKSLALFRNKDGLRTKRSRLRQDVPKLRPRKAAADDEAEEGYLAIGSTSRPRHGQEDGDTEDDAGVPDYRALEGRVKGKVVQVDEPSDSEQESAGEDEIPSVEESNPLRWRSIQLTRQVKEQPDDIDAWIELVDHQDALLRAGESLDHKVTENETHSYTEIKVSMLESALENKSTVRDRNRTLNYLMREGVKIWDPKTAEKKWSEVLKDERHNFILWKIHLDFCMSNIGLFQYDDVRQMLQSRLHQAEARFPDGNLNDVSEAIYIFLRATRFMYDAGFREVAVASWQALLELTFFRPPGLEGDEKLKSEFQDFWESEVPRFGEPDAQGWQQFVHSGEEAVAPEPHRYTHQAEDSRDSYKAWAIAERSQGQEARVPARTMDEGTEHDPFRVVMYSDIESFLFIVPQRMIRDASRQIIDAFLVFLGLPPFFCSTDWTEAASQDQFLTAAKRALVTEPRRDAVQADVEDAAPRLPVYKLLGLHAACTSDVLFSDEHWFKLLDPSSTAYTTGMDFMLQSLQKLVQTEEARALSPYYLALASNDSPVPVKKTAKTLLKRFPTNTGLYVGYALAEASQGQRQTAIKVLSSAADIAQADADGSHVLLWRTWAWLELEAGDKVSALKRLCSAADDHLRKSPDDSADVSGSNVLKARQLFSSIVSNVGPSSAGIGPRVGAESQALLAYLTVDGCTEPTSNAQGNISAAMTSIDESSREFSFRRCAESEAHEGLLQFAARLLYLNASKGPFRRAHMRGQLTKFLAYFPHNTILLSLLEWSDSSLRVVDETRAILYDKVLVPKHDCVTSRLFAIQHEMHKGNMNSTRAAYEHAVTSDACKSSVQVWISYIRFCHVHKELRARAKDVFYRALRHCPWSKEVMMEAFVTLATDMKSEELRSVYETMTSKGLRIHVDLDEFLETRQNGNTRSKDTRRR